MLIVWFVIPLLGFCFSTVCFAMLCLLFVVALSPPMATIHLMLPTEEGPLSEFFPCRAFPHLVFCVSLFANVFLRGIFLVFLENLWVWVRNCCCCGPAYPFETLYMILVCTNKLDLTCLQLHHSCEACVCLKQSGSLCTLSISPSRHVPMICYYLFPSLLTKKVTWHLPWGFNRHVSWRTRKMAFTVIEFRGP